MDTVSCFLENGHSVLSLLLLVSLYSQMTSKVREITPSCGMLPLLSDAFEAH